MTYYSNYTVQEAAKWLCVCVSTVRTLIREGKIPFSRPSGKKYGKIIINERYLHKIMDETRIEIIEKQLYK